MQDRAGYKLSVVARLKGPGVTNVQYKVRMENPRGDRIDYMLTLDGFKELGQLLVALHDFCNLFLSHVACKIWLVGKV